jgi:phage protein D
MAIHDHYVPKFSVKVGDKLMHHGYPDQTRDRAVDLLSVSVTDTVNQADSFSFTVRDHHPSRGHFPSGPELQWMDSGDFDEGRAVEIQLGYESKPADLFKFSGEITAVSANFPESGVPSLIVRGFSYFHQLQRRRRREPFKRVTDSAIAQAIADDMQWDAEIDATTSKHDMKSTLDQTYAAILLSRAQRIGYEIAVKHKTLYFQKPKYLANAGNFGSGGNIGSGGSDAEKIILEWGKDLRSFSPNLSTYNMTTAVIVRGTQTAQAKGKEALVGIATTDNIRTRMGDTLGPDIAIRLNGWGPNPALDAEHDVVDQAEADLVAVAQLEAKALEFISGRGSIIGNPKLRARMLIELRGLGRRFSGSYYVTSVTHTLDASGYRTDFEVKRNARNETR